MIDLNFQKIATPPAISSLAALSPDQQKLVLGVVRTAVEKSWLHSSELFTAWANVGKMCEEYRLCLGSVLSENYYNNKTFLESAIESCDPPTLRCLYKFISDGQYADGKVVRNSLGLYKVTEGDPQSGFGYLASPYDTLYRGYVGDICNGQRHGWGRCSSSPKDFYEGGWKWGQRHGQGRVQQWSSGKTTSFDALFESDKEVERLKRHNNSSKLDFFKKIKTMVFSLD